MARKTGTSSTPAPENDTAAEKPARRGKAPPAPAADTGRAAAEPTAAGGKSPSARKAPARKAPGAGVAAADVPAVHTPAEGETGAAASEPTTAGGKGRRAAPGTGVAETASAPAARRTSAKAGGSSAAKGGTSGAAKAGASATAKTGGSTAAKRGASIAANADGPAAARAEGSTAAKKPAAAKGRGGKRETFQETATRRREEQEKDQLQADLRAFAGARPSGWNHDDWVGFLTELAARGHDCSDPEQIGARLERERLAMSLEAIQGVEHSGVEALANRFQTLWSARHASIPDIAQTAGIPLPQAERVLHALREL